MQQIVLAIEFISFLIAALAGSLLFWVNKEAKFSTRDLTLIMFLFAVMSLNSVLLYPGLHLKFPSFQSYLLPFNFLIIPVFWLYVRSLLSQQKRIRKSYANIKKKLPGIIHNDHLCPESTKLFLIQFNNYDCKKKVELLFIEKKPFVDTTYSLEQLALDTCIPRHTLSAFINYEYGVNFREFLNRYRVDFFKDNLSNPRWKNLTLEAVASECGFGSRSSFIKNFKLITGETPGEYLKGYKHLQSSTISLASL